jgi:DNA-binding CsgD family transcriptional regulator
MHHLAIRSGRQVLVLHLLENVRARRRNERIGARLEALRMGVPDAAGSLTKREFEVLRLVVEGLSSVQIAAQLGIRPVTARNYVARVLDRLGVSSRSSALMRYLVGPSPSGGPDAGASPAVHGPAGRTTVRGGGNGPRPRQDRPPRST